MIESIDSNCQVSTRLYADDAVIYMESRLSKVRNGILENSASSIAPPSASLSNADGLQRQSDNKKSEKKVVKLMRPPTALRNNEKLQWKQANYGGNPLF